MTDRKIYITKSDFGRLKELIKEMRSKQDTDRRSIDELARNHSLQDHLELMKDAIRLKNASNVTEWPRVEELESELNRAFIVESDKIPPDVVTMNSKVCLKDLDTGKDEVYQVVYPEDIDIEENKISILAPIGTAILGYKLGDIIEWQVPAGLRRLKIKKVLYQPEAAGDHHL